MSHRTNPNNPNFPGIYSITHVESGRRYVGSSKNIYLRWRNHRKGLKGNYHASPYLQHAWSKYGAEAFQWEILETCPNETAVLIAREQHWIDQFKDLLFNTRKFAEPAGQDWMNSKEGEEYKQRRREAMGDWWETQPTVEKICEFCGKPFTTRNVYKPTRFCSKNCIQANRIALGKEHEQRPCVVCGNLFRTQRTRKARYCRSCKPQARWSLDPKDVPGIIQRIANGEPMLQIAIEFNVDHGVINSIGKRKRYTEIAIDQETEDKLRERFSVKGRYPKSSESIEKVRQIKRLLKYKVSQDSLARKFGFSKQMICNIKKGRVYPEVEPAPDPSPLLPGFD